jgi:hypothetical protein
MSGVEQYSARTLNRQLQETECRRCRKSLPVQQAKILYPRSCLLHEQCAEEELADGGSCNGCGHPCKKSLRSLINNSNSTNHTVNKPSHRKPDTRRRPGSDANERVKQREYDEGYIPIISATEPFVSADFNDGEVGGKEWWKEVIGVYKAGTGRHVSLRWTTGSERWAYELVAAAKLGLGLADDWQARSGVSFWSRSTISIG